ncbi:hypothetical protein [Nocardia sp. NPDC055049]
MTSLELVDAILSDGARYRRALGLLLIGCVFVAFLVIVCGAQQPQATAITVVVALLARSFSWTPRLLRRTQADGSE